MARNSRRRSRLDTNDLAGYGSVANGTVNVDRAARGLGVSKTEVRQAIRQAEAAQSNTFLRRISGRREADSAEGTSMRGMLQAVFGRGPRGGAVNARAAAQSLGVSPGTVRRWAAEPTKNVGFDCAKGQESDMFEAGIVDPTKVARSALQNAASVACLLMSTDTLVANVPEDEEADAMPGMDEDF